MKTTRGQGASSRREKGLAAEAEAEQYLTNLGWRMIARNWRCRSGELDLVAEHNQVLVIVEVRSRSAAAEKFGTALEAVDARKVRQVRETAAAYIHYHRLAEKEVRFDVIAISWASDGTLHKLQHVMHAF